MPAVPPMKKNPVVTAFFMLAAFTRYIAICLVMFGTGSRGNAQSLSSEIQATILRQILSLQFASAERLIHEYIGGPEMGPAYVYLQNYLEFLETLITGDGSSYQRYLSGAMARLDAIESVYGQWPERLHLISAIYLQSSFLNALHGENFRAARNFYVAKRYLRQAESARPGDPFNEKIEGLINLVAGAAPAEYQWLMSIFGIRGDMQLGLQQLEAYHEGTSGPERLESCLILLYARQMTGLETGALADGCAEDASTLHRYLHAYQALKTGHSQEVVELLVDWEQDPGETYLAYFDLLYGEALLNITDQRAGDQLIRFLGNTRGDYYIKTAWHKLSWHYFLEGDSAAYRLARANAIEKGNMMLEDDKQAFREASEDALPNPVLLRSRLLFDGGFYQRACEILQEINPGDLTNRKDSLEYTYRQARIADLLGSEDEAISKYHELMEAGMASSWYFPSNAALHLGMIYEGKGDTARALDSYQTCLKMNRSAYRNSIGNKAKLGIGRLR